ncbi:MAG: PAS domain-containing protein, partial [Mariprofundaceae bacterium]|nr:PAS domain-containing protein [Mariprofundaceae bacterium]
MTVGFLVPLVMVLLWWWHVRLLKRALANNERMLSNTQGSQSDLEKKLEQRSHRFDELLSAIHEPVLRVDRTGRVMSANDAAARVFTIRDVNLLPESMVVFYRNPDWLKSFSKAVESLPEVVALPEIFIGEQVFLPRLAGLGEDQGLLLCLDVTAQYRLQEQRKTFVADLMHDLKTP